MHTTDLDISKLSVAERIQLAEDLWDSVAAETGELALTEAQTAELDRRLADLRRDPGAGGSWDAVRARVEQRLHKVG
jgi:putative addiction module component (TIGR02574 family)